MLDTCHPVASEMTIAAGARAASASAHIGEFLRCAMEIDTSSAPPAEQFDYYQTWNTNLIDLKLLWTALPSFQARQKVWQLGDLALCSIEFPSSGYSVQWEHRKRPLLDHWTLSVPFSRSPDGNMIAGKSHLQCLELPERGTTRDDQLVMMFLPRTWESIRSSKITANGAALNFLADYMLLLHRSVHYLRAEDIPYIVKATASLCAATFAPSKDNLSQAQGAVDAVLTTRIHKVVTEMLADRDLTPDKLCHKVGVSRSHLYKILEPVGGVSSYIRRKRLLRTRDMLADRSNDRTISGIAEEWGFTDASAYSRMFKSEFGLSPKDARELGRKGHHHPSWLTVDRPIDDVGSLLISNSLGLSLSHKR